MLRRIFDRSPFASILDAHAELRQLGAIRIATGLLCLARIVPSIWASRYYFEEGAWGIPWVTVEGLPIVALILLVTAGVFTPVSTVALLLATRRYEGHLESESLSTDVLSLLLSLLVLTSAGARRSVDAIWLRQPGWLGSLVRAPYRLVGIPSTSGIRIILVLYFVAFGLINLGGAVNHWHEEAWRSGRALDIIFSSTYMSRVWGPWRALDLRFPELAMWISWVLTMIQLVAQTTMLALVWWRPTARLVIAWGALFFLSSIIALQLHYLGAFELLIWAAIFHRPHRSDPTPAGAFIRRPWSEQTIAAAGAIFLTIFVAHESWAFAGIREYPFPKLRRYLDTIGVHSPRVFNYNDLPLGDPWCIVYRGDREERLPYHGSRGERLAWVQWNDLLLYRSSIRWRNEFHADTVLDPHRDAVGRLQQLVVFDHRRRHVQTSTYVVDVFVSSASRTDLPPAERFERRFIGSIRFHCSGERNATRCTPVVGAATE